MKWLMMEKGGVFVPTYTLISAIRCYTAVLHVGRAYRPIFVDCRYWDYILRAAHSRLSPMFLWTSVLGNALAFTL